ncbi:MAG TPA: hypothetical protein VFJ85_02275 [Acidimicrobiales bacterium]|nr:hypothetical protein [Acidimicrobiales bacterium]
MLVADGAIDSIGAIASGGVSIANHTVYVAARSRRRRRLVAPEDRRCWPPPPAALAVAAPRTWRWTR